MHPPLDEFTWIDRLRPLTRGDPQALNLMDDAAVLPSRPGFDLVVSTDAMVEGVHFPTGEALDIVARRLLRTSLSDLAAKAAEPFGYFLTTAWPARFSAADRDDFIAGLDQDGRRFDVVLLGGDTVVTSGPLTVSATVMGWTPAGRMIPRGGATAGDLCVVCGTIGDGVLGLLAARGEIKDVGDLAARYRLQEPLFALRQALRDYAVAAADVSDGLLADSFHIAEASGLGLTVELSDVPLSTHARIWLDRADDRTAALLRLATGGDDYAIVCAIPPMSKGRFARAVAEAGLIASTVGRYRVEPGLDARFARLSVAVSSLGWRH